MAEAEELTKVTVLLVPKAVGALDSASAQTGDTRTDTINRALQVYAYLVPYLLRDGSVFVTTPSGQLQRVTISGAAASGGSGEHHD